MTKNQYRIFNKVIKIRTEIISYKYDSEFDFFKEKDIKLLKSFAYSLFLNDFYTIFEEVEKLNTDKKAYLILNSTFLYNYKIKYHNNFIEDKFYRVLDIFCKKYNYEKQHSMIDGFFVDRNVQYGTVAQHIRLVVDEIKFYLEKKYDK